PEDCPARRTGRRAAQGNRAGVGARQDPAAQGGADELSTQAPPATAWATPSALQEKIPPSREAARPTERSEAYRAQRGRRAARPRGLYPSPLISWYRWAAETMPPWKLP